VLSWSLLQMAEADDAAVRHPSTLVKNLDWIAGAVGQDGMVPCW
jgi:hypothetical protein